MKRWISGQDILQTSDLTALELLDCIKNGLPAYIDQVGTRLIDSDTLSLKKLTIQEIEEFVRSKSRPSNTFISLGDGWRPNEELSKYLAPYIPTTGEPKDIISDEEFIHNFAICQRIGNS